MSSKVINDSNAESSCVACECECEVFQWTQFVLVLDIRIQV